MPEARPRLPNGPIVCPDCGTALVRVEPPFQAEATPAPPPGEIPSEPPPPKAEARFGQWPRRGAVALALLGAFGLGSMLPKDEPTPGAAREPLPREIHPRDPLARSPDGVRLRLDLVIQTGTRFTALVAPETGFDDRTLIEDAAVQVTTGDGVAEETYSVDELSLRPTQDGFTIDGSLQSNAPIRELRITSIQVRDRSAPEWGANLSRILPVGSDEPRVVRLAEPAERVEGGTIRLASLVCWRDRVEAVFDLRGDDGTPGNRSEMAGLEMRVSIPNSSGTLVGRAIAASKVELVSAGQLIVRFELVPENAGPVVITATRMLNFVAGPWIWRLP